jgi:hypothetical protein
MFLGNFEVIGDVNALDDENTAVLLYLPTCL